MKLSNTLLLCFVLAVCLFVYKKKESNKPQMASPVQEFELIVSRGAFHYDCFELTPTSLSYFPEQNSQHLDAKYKNPSKVTLNREIVETFILEIETRGFWDLKTNYRSTSSCSSELRVTLFMNGTYKSIRCDDYEKDCPEILKFIEQKIVELEGNNLKRVYLPG